jgi:histidinol phosphatase-like enzyme (inositol monophosphatase family)
MTDAVSASELLAAVSDAASMAGRIALAYFGHDIAVEIKGDGSPVTRADREAEQAVRRWIETRFPHDGIVGEEFGVTSGTRRRWFIDPIDGTKSFVHGVPLWGTMVAVAEGPDVIAGAIACPAVNELVAAAVGEGCWFNGNRCRVSECDDPSQATILATDTRFLYNPERALLWATLGTQVAIARTWGDCYGYVQVAAGRAELMVDDRLSPWDTAALIPIITEAGGVFSDWRGGHAMDGGDAVASNARLAPFFQKALGITSSA